MSNLNAFLSQNIIKQPNVFYAPSKRIIGDDGKPVPFEICCITPKENKEIKKGCMKRVPIPGKKNQYMQDFDANEYTARLAVRCTIFPDLNNKELQDSHGVMSAEDLILTILTPGEYEDYTSKILEANGFKNEDELIDEAKN